MPKYIRFTRLFSISVFSITPSKWRHDPAPFKIISQGFILLCTNTCGAHYPLLQRALLHWLHVHNKHYILTPILLSFHSVLVRIHTYIHLCIHIYIHTNRHIYIHTHPYIPTKRWKDITVETCTEEYSSALNTHIKYIGRSVGLFVCLLVGWLVTPKKRPLAWTDSLGRSKVYGRAQ
jgi:hypothetical protein